MPIGSPDGEKVREPRSETAKVLWHQSISMGFYFMFRLCICLNEKEVVFGHILLVKK